VLNPLHIILQRLEVDPPVFAGDEIRRTPGPVIEQFADTGLLRQAEPSGTATCASCGELDRIEFVSNIQTGRNHAYLPCRQCGLVEVPLNHLDRWIADIPVFLSAVFAGGGIRGCAEEVVSGRLWRLGKANWARRSREVYFTRCVDQDDGHRVFQTMARRSKAVIFTPTIVGAENWRGATRNPVIAFESVVSLDRNRIAFDIQFVEGRLIDAGLTDSSKKKRPPMKRSSRAAKIEMLTSEMSNHLRSARAHAVSTKDLTGTPELLPRPSQKDLAARTNLSDSDVSRCLNDKAARELNLLWSAAADIYQIMGWKGRPGRS
jgi:hypothetical protein